MICYWLHVNMVKGLEGYWAVARRRDVWLYTIPGVTLMLGHSDHDINT